MLCIILDVIILTIVSAMNTARLKPVEMSDIRHGTEVDVGTTFVLYLHLSQLDFVMLIACRKMESQ